jgi:hypothetical protein
VRSLLVFQDVIFSMKSFLVALARWHWAFIDLGPVDFAFVAFEAAFVTEGFAIAGYVMANVGTNVFVLMSPTACKYGSPEIP